MSTLAASLPRSGSLAERYAAVRRLSGVLCETLEPEDCCIQSMPDVSPTRWHLAHTTWFFETFVLAAQAGYRPENNQFTYLFNSYYNAVGEQFPRDRRGLLSRPTLSQVWAYRRAVDDQMQRLLESSLPAGDPLASVVELGLHHEQQHQELMLTDIKHVLSCNPLWPVFRAAPWAESPPPRAQRWSEFDEGLYAIGHQGPAFAYDNEAPRHRVFLEAFQLADRLVTCGEYQAFIDDGGYRRPELWLAEGWQQVCAHRWQAPLYWVAGDDGPWQHYTLAGLVPIDRGRPVCHVSYFEADAFARWSGARLPREAEWEVAAGDAPPAGNFVDALLAADAPLHPAAPAGGRPREQLFGDTWEWTASAYAPYPGYHPPDGALGEYNGKFMCNQYVLRGGSCATVSDHIRPTYRNFFPAHARWQFSGIRLAR